MTLSNFSEILRQAFYDCPNQKAVTLLFNHRPEQVINYHDLVWNSAACADVLNRAGIKPGEVVVLILNHGPDLIYSFFGAILSGAIPSIMPFLTEKLAPEQYRASIKSLFEITSPALVITYPDFLQEVETACINSSVRAVITSDQLSNQLKDEIHWDEYAGLQRSSEDIVLLQHSSGTTGLQKGVALTNQAVHNQIQSYSRALHSQTSDVIVSWLPLYHDMGLIAGFIFPIMNRNHLVLMSPFDWIRAPYRLMQAVSEYQGTLTWLPNFAFNFCASKIRKRDLEGVNLSSLRGVINCSEPMHWKSHQMFLEYFGPYGLRPNALATCYAMAENVFAVSQGGIDAPINIDLIDGKQFVQHNQAVPTTEEHGSLRILSAGRPIENTRVRIIDQAGNDLPDRTLGEIAIQSNCMLAGYYHRPDLTEKAFLNGWYLTGDLGYLTDGEIYVTGRKKDLIIVGGKNIYPQDIERLANEVEGVHPGRVVAFGVYNERSGTEDVVVIAEIDGTSEELDFESDNVIHISDEIRKSVTQGSEITLRHVRLVTRNWLLKTSSGKIARSANKEKWLAEMKLKNE